jgi:hypothetical protein
VPILDRRGINGLFRMTPERLLSDDLDSVGTHLGAGPDAVLEFIRPRKVSFWKL